MDQTFVARTFADRRRKAAEELTHHIESHAAFSFLRLGDGEIQCIQAVRNGEKSPRYRYVEESASSIELVHSVSGIEGLRVPQLVKSYETCTFLDYCDSIPAVRNALNDLALDRPLGALRNDTPETSNIIFEWTRFELRNYLKRHRCLLASAESAMLEELHSDSQYRMLANDYFPGHSELFFHQLRDDGRRYSENLDLIRQDLIQDIQRHRIDTLFLSLASGAKILCSDLAPQLGIRTIDFGSMPRALAYSGSPGYQTSRDYHNPFLFRVPLRVFMKAFERAHPTASFAERVSKAHSQLHLDLLDLEPMIFNNSDAVAGHCVLPSAEALQRFRIGWRHYLQMYSDQLGQDPDAWRLHKAFRYWCLKKGMGWQGKAFLALAQCKRFARQLASAVLGGLTKKETRR